MTHMCINGALSADLWGHDDAQWMLNLLSYYTLLSSFFYLREDSLVMQTLENNFKIVPCPYIIDAGIIGR